MTLGTEADDTRPANALADLRAEAAREDTVRASSESTAAAAAGEASPAAASPAPGRREPTAGEVEEWRAAVDMLADELQDRAPGLKAVYTEERRALVSDRVARVMVKYGIAPLAFFEKWREEIALAICLRPIVRDTLRVLEAAKAPPPGTPDAAVKPAPPAAAAAGALKPNLGGAA